MEGERTLIGWTPSNKLLVPSRRNLAAARKRPHYVAVLPLPPSPPQLFVNSWWTLCTDQWLSGSNRHRVRCRRIHRFNLMIGYRPDVVPIKSKRVRAGKLSAGRPVWQQKRRPASAAVNDADGWEGWGGGCALFFCYFLLLFFLLSLRLNRNHTGKGSVGSPVAKTAEPGGRATAGAPAEGRQVWRNRAGKKPPAVTNIRSPDGSISFNDRPQLQFEFPAESSQLSYNLAHTRCIIEKYNESHGKLK